jgi:hypothetical protein
VDPTYLIIDFKKKKLLELYKSCKSIITQFLILTKLLLLNDLQLLIKKKKKKKNYYLMTLDSITLEDR